MAVIGSFLDLVFEVSEKKTQTFNDFTRTNEPRYQKHEIIGRKPKPEFIGPGADTISFDIVFKAELGVNPEKQLEMLRRYARTGSKGLFIRGNEPISVNYWVIEKLVETHKRIDNLGNVLEIHVTINLGEYEREEDEVKKATISTSASSSSTAPAAKKAVGKMKITVKSVHIRSGPGVQYKVLGYAMNGDELTVYGEKNGWYDLGGGRYITANSAYSTFRKVT